MFIAIIFSEEKFLKSIVVPSNHFVAEIGSSMQEKEELAFLGQIVSNFGQGCHHLAS